MVTLCDSFCVILISRSFQNMTTISIDTEWRHNFFSIRPKTRVSIMQIANDHECFIIDCLQLARHDASMAFLRQIVEQIFRNANILKLGYSIDDDLRMIAKTIEQATGRKISMDENRSVVDMRSLYEFVVRSPSYRNLLASSNLEESRSTRGLSQLTTLLLGSTIDKQEQLSDWERRPLRSSQINYAAIDACCLIDCYHSFSKLLHKKMNITFDEFIAGPFSNPKFKFSGRYLRVSGIELWSYCCCSSPPRSRNPCGRRGGRRDVEDAHQSVSLCGGHHALG